MRTRFDKRPDIISGKTNLANVSGAGEFGGGALSPSVGVLGTLRKFLGSKEQDLLKIDLNATEIITDQDNKTHKKLM